MKFRRTVPQVNTDRLTESDFFLNMTLYFQDDGHGVMASFQLKSAAIW